jgi:hypothetical protein
VDEHDAASPERLLGQIDRAHADLGRAHERFLRLITEIDRHGVWANDGARDLAQWLWMRYGISDWKARRFIDAAAALPQLPAISDALSRGQLGVDKVIELTRFATFENEDGLIPWAQHVSAARIRHEADVARTPDTDEAASEDRSRSVTWSYRDEGRRFEMHADLPAVQGAAVAKAIDRVAASIPSMPDEAGGIHAPARRADALVALCSVKLVDGPDTDRATVVLHARTGSAGNDACTGAEIEGGGVAHPSTLERLLCAARVETVHEDQAGRVVGVGRITRVPPAWLLRQIRYRDGGCRFPGCGTNAFTQAHHIVFWREGGATDLDNLATLCSWHHKLVHEYGWWIKGSAQRELRWYRPDGTRYRAGPAPAEANGDDQALPVAGWADAAPCVGISARGDRYDDRAAVGRRSGSPGNT